MKNLTLISCATLLGLASCASPSDTYIQADRATFNSIAADYLRYVAQDANLTQLQKDRRERTVKTWRIRLEAAETNR